MAGTKFAFSELLGIGLFVFTQLNVIGLIMWLVTHGK